MLLMLLILLAPFLCLYVPETYIIRLCSLIYIEHYTR